MRLELAWVLLLIVAGAGLLWIHELEKPGYWREGSSTVIGHGPARARWDAANGTTLAVFQCGHWECEHGVVVQGDARDELARRAVLLKPAGDASWDLVSVAPFDVGGPGPIVSAYQGPFEVVPTWPRLGALLVGWTLVGLGLGLLAARSGIVAPLAAVAGPVFGVGVGWWGSTLGVGSIAIVFFLGPVLLAVCGILSLWPRPRRVVLPFLLGSLLIYAVILSADVYYPSEPVI